MILKHQPDQANFKAILPEDIDWKPFPAFPAGARLAVMVATPPKPVLMWSGSRYRMARN